MSAHRRTRGTGTIYRRASGWVALAPQSGGRGKAKWLRIATVETRWAAECALDAWLNAQGRIVRKGT